MDGESRGVKNTKTMTCQRVAVTEVPLLLMLPTLPGPSTLPTPPETSVTFCAMPASWEGLVDWLGAGV